MIEYVHDSLPCGIEYGVAPFPGRHVVSFQIRVLSGSSADPQDKGGLARLLVETIDKGTQKYGGRELSDAFDAIGASWRIGCGRETMTCSTTVLPEHFEKAVALHAEYLRTPTFPLDAFEVNVDLAKQELLALEDDAQGVADKMIMLRAFGSPLGRHPLGEAESLDRMTREDIQAYWQTLFAAGRILVSVAGAIGANTVADVFQRNFDSYGASDRAGREFFPTEFAPGVMHRNKDLEQEQIGICWPGVDPTHEDFPAQQAMLGVLSGGMSSRLFTEVREKQGLVYWVNAWQETPRGTGMIFLGASTTPQRCDQTYKTLMREVDRLAEDIEVEELERAVTGMVSSLETRGDSTSSRCNDLGTDLFYFGRPRQDEEKIDRIRGVTIDDIRRYLNTYPRDRRCVVTLGPKALAETPNDGCAVASENGSR